MCGLSLSDSWDTAVDFFDRLNQSAQWEGMHAAFLKLLNPKKSDLALEVGCGPGVLACRLAKKVSRVDGIDISPDMVRRAVENARKMKVKNADFHVGVAERLHYRALSFDICYSFATVYLLRDDSAGVREMARVARAGGIMALVNPSNEMSVAKIDSFCKQNRVSGVVKDALYGWLGAALNHRRYSQADAEKLLSSAGLEKIEHLQLLGGMVIASKGIKKKAEWIEHVPGPTVNNNVHRQKKHQ